MKHRADPVCGKRMNANKAHIVINFEGEDYYLCCPLCQKEFEQNPEKYVKRDKKI
ncbi:MAG: YHS domain-containing protein [Calditrichaeota bacterium]|nr:YHS domain-containing protein [Calditrichota bacterium]